MRRGLRVMGVIICLLLPEGAAAQPSNVAASRAYVRAWSSLANAATAQLPVEIGATERQFGPCTQKVEEAIDKVSAAASSPKRLEEGHVIAEEIFGAEAVAGLKPLPSTVVRTARAALRVRWSDPKLAMLVRSRLNGALASFKAVPAPDLCADFEGWAASNFEVLPASSTRS